MVGAFAFVAVSLVAAPSARGGIEDLLDFGDPELLACEISLALAEVGEDLCFDLGCDPSEKECSKICKVVSKTCTSTAKVTGKLINTIAKGLIKEISILCKTADEPKECKFAAKFIGKLIKTETKQLVLETRQSCGSNELLGACDRLCNDRVDVFACGL